LLSTTSSVATNKTTDGNDTIYALTDQTLTSADIISGGLGTDTIIAAYATALTAGAPVLNSIEAVVLRQSGNANTTFDATNTTGLTSVTFDSVSESTAVTAQAATALTASVTTLGITNTTSDDADTFTFTFADAAISGTADSKTLNVQGNSAVLSGVVLIRGTSSTSTGSGVETLTINSAGTGTAAASTLASVLVADGGGTTSSLKTLNVTGTSALTITASVDFAGTSGGTINASGMSGALTLTATTGDEPITFTGSSGKNTITTAAGSDSLTGGISDDSFTIGIGNDTVVGGAGNDRIIVAATTGLAAGDSINLGEGTRDAVVYNNVTALNSTGIVAANLTLLNATTGVEVVGSSTANVTAIVANYFTQDIFELSGSNAVNIAATEWANETLVLKTSITGNTATTATGSALAVTGSGPAGTFNLEFNGAAAVVIGSTAVADADDLISLRTVSGITTVNILSTSSASDITTITNAINANVATTPGTTEQDYTIDNTGATSFNLTGDTNFSITAAVADAGGTAAFKAAVAFNASTFTGKLTLDGSASGDVLTGGTGIDTIKGAAGNDVIVGGAGNDLITGGAGADDLSGGAGDDDFFIMVATTNTAVSTAATASSLTATIANGDTITFGNGVDIIRGFVTGSDDLSVSAATIAFENVAPTALVGQTAGALAESTIFASRGTYNESSKVFTFAAAGADTILTYNNGTAADDVASTSTNYTVLIGTTTLQSIDFI
jgi:trimeric autotransporter adhesin